MDSQSILLEDLNLSLSKLDKSNLKINKKKVKEVNKTLDKVDMIDLWRKFNGDRNEYTFSSVVHGIYSKIDRVLRHKNLMIQCGKAEIVNASFSDHNAIKNLYVIEKPCKDRPIINWKLNNLILKND